MAWLTAAIGVGYGTGPLIAVAIAGELGEALTALVAALCFIIALPAVYYSLPETSPRCRPKAPWGLWRRCIELHHQDPMYWRVVAITALPEIAIIMFTTTVLSSLAVHSLRETKLWLGSVSASMALGQTLFSVALVPFLSVRAGDRSVLRYGYVSYGLASMMLACALTSDGMWAAVLPFSFGVAVLRSTPATFLSKRLRIELQGEGLGLLDSISSLLRVVSPVACGMLIDHAGVRAPLLLQAILCLTAALLVGTLPTDHMPAKQD